ncbi:MAG: dTDP-4-dehydrorhamnose reductase [Candidatus Dormibacteraeota bacterium]|nr:dTDP-4-dehydrorhamnose reductase [Candidatus Dormibacteraeota bacterium]
MSASRYFITGGSGQLARELSKRLPGSLARSREELSIADLDLLRRELSRNQAEVVFNCAAYNAVDRAEQDPKAAAAVNAKGAANVAQACREVGARLIHFSTNYVFDGKADRPYTEADEPRPLSAYGRSKLEGELRVLDALPSALVIRSSGLFGHRGSAIKGGSLPDRLLARARAGDRLSVVSDQRLNPTFTGHLADASIRAAAAGSTGVLHLVAGGCCSYHEFAVELLRVAGVDAEVDSVATTRDGTAADRPLNGCLTSIRAEPLPTWQEGLQAYWQTRSVNVG